MALPPLPARPDRVASLRALAGVLDSAVRIPGTPIRFGADALLGLVPGIGDVAGAALSGFIVLSAARLGVPGAVLARMVLNVAADTVIGAVPFVGDLFDVGWRANLRNVALLEDALADPRAVRRSSAALVAGVTLALLLLLAAGVSLTVAVVRALLGLV